MGAQLDELDIESEDKNVIGGIDRAIVNIGLVCLLIFPTYLFLILRPKAFVPLLQGEVEDGRDGLKLGPGITFVLSILLLLAVAYLFRGASAADVAADVQATNGAGIRQALSEGNLWRSIILSLPLYFIALMIGLFVQTLHLILRQKTDLRQSIGIGLYALSTFFILIVPFGITSENFETGGMQTGIAIAIFMISSLVIVPWQIFSFSRHSFGNKIWGAALVAGLTVILFFLAIIGLGYLVSRLNL